MQLAVNTNKLMPIPVAKLAPITMPFILFILLDCREWGSCSLGSAQPPYIIAQSYSLERSFKSHHQRTEFWPNNVLPLSHEINRYLHISWKSLMNVFCFFIRCCSDPKVKHTGILGHNYSVTCPRLNSTRENFKTKIVTCYHWLITEWYNLKEIIFLFLTRWYEAMSGFLNLEKLYHVQYPQ